MKLINKLKRLNENARIASEGIVSDVRYHIDTGSLMFNALLSGSIRKGFPGNKIVAFVGEPSTGKSLLTMLIVQKFLESNSENIVIYFDSEAAVQTSLLKQLDIDMNRYLHVPIDIVDDFKHQILKMIEEIKKESNEDGAGKIMFVLDSLGMLNTKKDLDDTLKGDLKADMGLRAKLIRSLFRNITINLGVLQCPMIVTSHTYDSMSQYAPSGISGGQGVQYSPSIIIELTQKKERDDEKKIIGIIMKATARKNRLMKQYKSVELQMNFSTGLNKYHGVIPFAIEHNLILKEGHKYIIGDNRYYLRELESDPLKYLNEDLLNKIDECVEKEFSYGKDNKGIEDECSLDEVELNLD